MGKFGIIILKGVAHVYKRVPEILEDGENGLPGNMRQLVQRLADNLKETDNQVVALEKEIKQWNGQSRRDGKTGKTLIGQPPANLDL